MPKVSIIIPIYNASKYIVEAIDSVLSQTYKDFEVIVIDDGSTDNTKEILHNFGEKINYYYQENQGAVKARNKAFELSKGELIAFLDQDDLWQPENLAKKVAYLDKNPQVPVVTSDFIFFGDVLQNSSFNERNFFLDKKVGDEFIIPNTLGLLIDQCFMFCPTTMLRRETFKKYGGFKVEVSDDYDLFLRIAAESNFGCINEVLVKKRVHDNATTRNYAKNFSSRLTALTNLNAKPGLSVVNSNKLKKRISATYMSWAYWLKNDGRLKESREKALLSISYRINLTSIKILLLSFGFVSWLKNKVKHE